LRRNTRWVFLDSLAATCDDKSGCGAVLMSVAGPVQPDVILSSNFTKQTRRAAGRIFATDDNPFVNPIFFPLCLCGKAYFP
jgi:hypothetical protein